MFFKGTWRFSAITKFKVRFLVYCSTILYYRFFFVHIKVCNQSRLSLDHCHSNAVLICDIICMHWHFWEHCCNQVDYLPCKITSLWKGAGGFTKGVCSSYPLGFDLCSFASGFGCTIKGSRRFFLCFFSKRALCEIKKKHDIKTTFREAEIMPQLLVITRHWSGSPIHLKYSCNLLQKSQTYITLSLEWFLSSILRQWRWTPACFLIYPDSISSNSFHPV